MLWLQRHNSTSLFFVCVFWLPVHLSPTIPLCDQVRGVMRCWCWALWGFGAQTLSKETSIHIKLFSPQSSSLDAFEKESSIHVSLLLYTKSLNHVLLFFALTRIFLSNSVMELLSEHWIFSPGQLWHWKIVPLFFSHTPLPKFKTTTACRRTFLRTKCSHFMGIMCESE